jgi:FkbM family methyltransferase
MQSFLQRVWNLRQKKVSPWRVLSGGKDFLLRKRHVRHFGKMLLVEPTLSLQSRLILYSGMYEAIEARLVPKALKPQDRVLELGTGAGFITMLCADIVGEKNLLTFEANPVMVDLSQRNFRHNGYQKLTTNHAILTSDPQLLKKGKAPFHPQDYFLAGSSYGKGDANQQWVETQDSNKVLKAFRPTVLVMDIEGEEVRFLPGIRSFGDIRTIILEVHPDVVGKAKLEKMCLYLRKHGFTKDVVGSYAGVETYTR